MQEWVDSEVGAFRSASLKPSVSRPPAKGRKIRVRTRPT